MYKGPFINYVRFPREEGGGNLSIYSYFEGEGSNPFLRNIFQVDILY